MKRFFHQIGPTIGPFLDLKVKGFWGALMDVPESSKGVKFVPLNHQKQTWELKFDNLGSKGLGRHPSYEIPRVHLLRF